MLLKLNKLFKKICKLWSKPILTRNGKTKGIHSSSLWLLYLKCLLVPVEALQANNFFVGFCPNARHSWITGKVCDFCDLCYYCKLTLAVKATFICRTHCFDVFKILLGQLIDRMLENKSLHERKATPEPPPRQESVPLVHILALPVKNGPLPAELKFRENTTSSTSKKLL